jgi:hypothetical protein
VTSAAAAIQLPCWFLPVPANIPCAGRFKDEARHQQRLSDMRDRCNALFDGHIRGHFQVKGGQWGR